MARQSSRFISPEAALTFDDVLIVPGKSAVEPKDANLKSEIARGFFVDIPILSAAMDRITESAMAIALNKEGGLGILHRNCSIEEQIEMVQEVKAAGARVGAACGPFDLERAKALEKAGVDVIVIDCAHGHNQKVIESAKKIKKSLKNAKVIVGNIATSEAAKALATFADGIKVGVGPGSICTTRVVSGVGMPQFSAIMEVAEAVKGKVPVIADGGIKAPGDAAKALAAGASSVMLGNMFAGTDEAPGEFIIEADVRFKEYRGMGSRAVLLESRASDRYLTSGRKILAEGVEALVKSKGAVGGILAQVSGGIQVAMGYVGAKTIPEFHKKAKFVRISPAALRENHPHDLDKVTG